ncbi:MAG TPA: hypothetical protein VH813_06755 [Candidatus Limnocylindrales bacterium]|jgi:hypothetical protein
MVAGLGWWATKTRQFRSHVGARVSASERGELTQWLAPAQLALFDSMHLADRRHGLDVVTALRREGVTDAEALLAGLLHDAGKARVGVWPRVAYSLGQRYGNWVLRPARLVPRFRDDLARLEAHAERSAQLAEAAGCPARTVELIRWQEQPRDPEFGELLRLADEAS